MDDDGEFIHRLDDVYIVVRLPKAMVKRMDEILEAAPSEYCGRLDLIMCAIRKEIDFQNEKLGGRVSEREG